MREQKSVGLALDENGKRKTYSRVKLRPRLQAPATTGLVYPCTDGLVLTPSDSRVLTLHCSPPHCHPATTAATASARRSRLLIL
ncbi:hypothetical protein PoB_002657900 [Plakobranchus ocellatus]|uniref:Uncharacterized protein n=1 Tax=Plakobranchus ocellatus TaxID=259542 RepID=A0AAV4A1H9_9GAST|nr:hypothetical protein PoB_002657900 [Plakobranchus ocellatus]